MTRGRNNSRAVRSARLVAGEGSVAAAAALVRRYVRRVALPPAAAARLAIVVEELVANLEDHAGLAAGEVVGLRLERRAGGTRLTLTDPGRPFDPRGAPAPGDLPPARGGGAGLALVRAWTQVATYDRRGEVNVLVLWLGDQEPAVAG